MAYGDLLTSEEKIRYLGTHLQNDDLVLTPSEKVGALRELLKLNHSGPYRIAYPSFYDIEHYGKIVNAPEPPGYRDRPEDKVAREFLGYSGNFVHQLERMEVLYEKRRAVVSQNGKKTEWNIAKIDITDDDSEDRGAQKIAEQFLESTISGLGNVDRAIKEAQQADIPTKLSPEGSAKLDVIKEELSFSLQSRPVLPQAEPVAVPVQQQSSSPAAQETGEIGERLSELKKKYPEKDREPTWLYPSGRGSDLIERSPARIAKYVIDLFKHPEEIGLAPQSSMNTLGNYLRSPRPDGYKPTEEDLRATQLLTKVVNALDGFEQNREGGYDPVVVSKLVGEVGILIAEHEKANPEPKVSQAPYDYSPMPPASKEFGFWKDSRRSPTSPAAPSPTSGGFVPGPLKQPSVPPNSAGMIGEDIRGTGGMPNEPPSPSPPGVKRIIRGV
ncbi:MAG TPA: hypothetical protein VFV38_18020 [Ktedonobacteraceae bacterium]|nr:hypothetical protein [Ktedonobacteraceae bacterium]